MFLAFLTTVKLFTTVKHTTIVSVKIFTSVKFLQAQLLRSKKFYETGFLPPKCQPQERLRLGTELRSIHFWD